MTFLLENFIKNPQMQEYAKKCGTVISTDNPVACAAEIDFLVRYAMRQAIMDYVPSTSKIPKWSTFYDGIPPVTKPL